MLATPIHDAEFLTIWGDDSTRIIGIDWKDTTAGMSDEQFKMELTLSQATSKSRRHGAFWSM